MENQLSNETYREILELAINKSEMRRWMLNPVNAFGRTHATDGYSVVTVPEIGEFENVESKMKNVYPIEPNMNKQYSVAEIQAALDKMPKVNVYSEEKVKCDACNGDGEVEYEFSHKGKDYQTDVECPICEGDGFIMQESSTVIGQDYNYDYAVKIGICGMHIKRIKLLLDIAEKVGSDMVELLNQTEPHHANLFRISDVEIIAMPVSLYENDGNCPVKI